MKQRVIKEGLIAALVGVFLLVGIAADAHASDSRPNILLIVADDMGYADIGPYGGEIRTPNLNTLADSGITMTNFHANPSCSPTRAALMSGTDTHIAGMGVMFEMRFGAASPEQMVADGYEGYLLPSMDTLPQKLLEAGYHTYMAGKWHLANLQGGLSTTIPAARGFERSFALMQGGASHFGDGLGALPSQIPPIAIEHGARHNQFALYVENGSIGVPLPEDFYSTTYYTDKLIEYIKSNQGDGKPILPMPPTPHPIGLYSYPLRHWKRGMCGKRNSMPMKHSTEPGLMYLASGVWRR